MILLDKDIMETTYQSTQTYNTNSIIAYHHLGLGDHFICNGLINALSEQYDAIYLICKANNYTTVFSMYSDNPKIVVCKIDKEPEDIIEFVTESKLQFLQIGFRDFDNQTFDKTFYTHLGFDFSLRYDNFKLPSGLNKDVYETHYKTEFGYCLIHNESSVGTFDFDIDTQYEKKYIKRGITDNLLDYIEVIKNAKEIHCVDSSVYHLVDSINVDAKLFYHDLRNENGNKIRVSDKWVIV